jgi:hypothetical protein
VCRDPAAAGLPFLPCQSIRRAGGSSVIPSHHTSPSGVTATLVKMTFACSIFIAFGLVWSEVPGATPNRPYSGLIARRRPSAPGLIQAMSSPMVVTFQSANTGGGMSIARLVLPQAEGNAAAK